jgi:cytochrome oxidase Cu insertion factor (SCO1/SenC/PrrC family)
MNKNKAWAILMLGLVIVLPLVSYLLMRQGTKLRQNATASEMYYEAKEPLPEYTLFTHRGDTLMQNSMLGKAYILEFYSNDCYQARYEGKHPLFELQEDYYGKTKSLRIVSVRLDQGDTELQSQQMYANLYATREIWHIAAGDTNVVKNIFAACNTYLQEKNIVLQNSSCPAFVFLVNKSGKICGAYNPKDEKHFSKLFTDVLFAIDQKHE